MNSIPLPVLWLELSIGVVLAGALCVSAVRDPFRAWRLGLGFSSVALACTILACLGYYLGRLTDVDTQGSFHARFLGREFLAVDELSAPLVPLVGLLHFLTALATGRAKMRRFSLSWSLT